MVSESKQEKLALVIIVFFVVSIAVAVLYHGFTEGWEPTNENSKIMGMMWQGLAIVVGALILSVYGIDRLKKYRNKRS